MEETTGYQGDIDDVDDSNASRSARIYFNTVKIKGDSFKNDFDRNSKKWNGYI